MFPTLPASKLATYLPALDNAVAKGRITTVTALAAFLANVAVESRDLDVWEENLNYSAEGLLKTFGKRYTPELAAQHARRPQIIANYVYANRNGNGDEKSGHGWKYRGRGPIQITGLGNYLACGVALGVDLAASPDLLATNANLGLQAAVWYWNSRNLTAVANKPDFDATIRGVNGPAMADADKRRSNYKRNLEVLGRRAILA